MIKINFPKFIKKNKKKLKNIMALFVLAPALVIPTFAEGAKAVEKTTNTKVEETQNPNTQNIKFPTFSNWATHDLNEAQFMGIFPNERFYDGTDYRKEAKLEELKKAYELSKNKLEKNSIKTGGDFEFKNLTRIEVLNSISKLLNKSEFKIKDLQDKNIFRGKSDEKYLNTKIPLQEALALYARSVNGVLQENDKTSKGYFYEVKNKGNTIYMLGSIHVGKNEMYPIDEEIINSLKKSQEIYMEVDLSNPEAAKIMQEKMYYKDDNTLKADLGDELYAKVVKIFNGFGLKEEAIRKMRPWAIVNSLSIDPTGQTGNAAFGVESYFLSQALLNGIKVGELESIEFQRDLLSGFDKETYITMIKNNVEEIEKNGYKNMNAQLDEMLESWIKGDKKVIAESFRQNSNDPSAKFNNALVETRDVKMAEKIDKLLKQDGKNTYFILVGAAHLVPDESVTGILKDKGYEVVEK